MTARTLIVDAGGTTRLVKKWWVIDAGGTARMAKRVFVIDSGGTPRLIFANTVNAIATPTNEHASGFAPITLTTGVTTASATGGIPPYTFHWTWSSGGSGITITSPLTAATAFSAHINPGDTLTGVAQCTVTDSIGNIGFAFCGVSITATN
jgi:hypothetical protein